MFSISFFNKNGGIETYQFIKLRNKSISIMKNINLFAIFLLLSQAIFAQNKPYFIVVRDTTPVHYKWMGDYSRTLTSMKLSYQKPKGFNEVGKSECFKDYPKLESTFSCLSNRLVSKDEQFISFLIAYNIFTEEFRKEMDVLFFGKEFDYVDKQHVNQIKGIIRSYYNEEAAKHWKDSVTYYPPDITKDKFNADSVISFSIALRPEDYYKNEYKYVDILLLQKKGRGYVYFVSFYTDKAKRKLNKYKREIEGVLRYED